MREATTLRYPGHCKSWFERVKTVAVGPGCLHPSQTHPPMRARARAHTHTHTHTHTHMCHALFNPQAICRLKSLACMNHFPDLVNDWASKSRPDLLHFVPYTWVITVIMKEFELITLCNEYNWIDCSSQNQENAHIAFCGDLFDLSFDLPFSEFLPTTVPLKFWIQVITIILVSKGSWSIWSVEVHTVLLLRVPVL